MKDIGSFLDQLYEFTLSEIKARYRRTFAGFIWVLLNPIILYGIQAFTFKKILKLQIDNYSLFLLSGLIPWVFIVQSIHMSVNAFSTKGSLLKSFRFNPLILIISPIFNNFINFMIAFIIILIPISWLADFKPIGVPFLPIGILLLSLGCVLVCLFFATLQVFYRDVEYVINFVMSVMFFITPIYFTKEFMPEKYKWLIFFNPFYSIIEPFRMCFYGFDFFEFVVSTTKGFVTIALLSCLTCYYWKRKKNAIYFRA